MTFEEMWASLLPIGRDADGGYRRFVFGAAELECRHWFVAQAEARGLEVERDGNGNLFAWWRAGDGPGVVTGSHFDSVPGGGAFDGPLGIVSAFAAVDRLRADGFVPSRPLAIAAFAEEEGARFGIACLGSRLLTGEITPARAAALVDDQGISFAEALAAASATRPDKTGMDRGDVGTGPGAGGMVFGDAPDSGTNGSDGSVTGSGLGLNGDASGSASGVGRDVLGSAPGSRARAHGPAARTEEHVAGFEPRPAGGTPGSVSGPDGRVPGSASSSRAGVFGSGPGPDGTDSGATAPAWEVVRAQQMGRDEAILGRIGCFVELHVEQGRMLAEAVGVAGAIWPHGRWRLEFRGRGDHAGTTRLSDRRDPMIPFAHAVLAAREAAERNGARATVGKARIVPGGVNAIASRVTGWLDVRGPDDNAVRAVVAEVAKRVEQHAAAHDVAFALSEESYSPVVAFDPALRDRILNVLGPVPVLPTGAGHDAGILAPHVPTAMLFVRNPTGVSHAPEEHAETPDCLAGVTALTNVLRALTT